MDKHLSNDLFRDIERPKPRKSRLGTQLEAQRDMFRRTIFAMAVWATLYAA